MNIKGLLILGIMVILAGCGAEPVTKVNSTNPTVTEQKAPTKVYNVGETLKIGDTDLTITKATIESPEQYVTANKGNVLVLSIEGMNKGSQSWFLSDTDFNLYDKTGGKLEAYYSGQDTSVFGGEINQGKKVSGKIRFDVSKADSYELVYKPNFLTDQEVKFNIKPSK